MIRVFLWDVDGQMIRIRVEHEILGRAGILSHRGRHYVFSHFVHGEDAVEFHEAVVVDVTEARP